MEEEPKIKIKTIKKPKLREKSKLIQPVEFTLKQEYIEKCEKGDEKKCNEFMLKKELLERQELGNTPTENEFLYPDLNDPNFIIKIAEKKEFNDTKYDGEVYDIKKHAEVLANADFQLAPHQSFVRNFLSFQTPYNSLLLYHGLGSGKSLTAIGVSEEMRSYLKQIGMAKRIIVVASPNVQDNFRVQLFDERKLKLVNGLWNIKGAVGTNFLKEINPMNMKGLSKEKVISQIQSIIKHSYLFLGYQEFANYIEKTCLGGEYISRKKGESRKQLVKCSGSKRQQFALKQEFNNRLIVIDEIHNIRMSDDSENKIVAEQLMNIVKYADNLRLLFLSATPMYNSYTEIIWLLNIMNINDRRPTIDVSDVFDKNGDFKKNPSGKELLIRKATGYVSFVRGNNPYTFPYRVYPSIFLPKNTFPDVKYPKYQMNGKVIKPDDKIEILSLYLTQIGEYQSLGYKFIIDNLRNKNITTVTTKTGVVRQMPTFENIESFGYTLLQMPIEALNIVYPIEGLEEVVKTIRPVSNYSESEVESVSMREKSGDEVEENLGAQVVLVKEPSSEPNVASHDFEPKVVGGVGEKEKDTEIYINSNELTGNNGLKRIMSFVDSKNPPEKGSYEYRDTPFGHIFSQNELGKYSSKMKNICQHILSSTGIVLIYSQYIDGGIVPMALALEELGLVRYGKDAKNLFLNAPTEPLDFRTMKPREDKKDKGFKPVRYAMITGDTRISPNNDFEVKGLTDETNMDGSKIKVVLISRAGSEGIDLKCIRQVHILDPWYNMNRIEQIIGRAVRNSSHKALPFEERNVEIFLYGTILENNEEESADLYVYRIAETKAVQIGRVSRVLKETSVDCILNHDQSNFTKENIQAKLGKTYKQILSDGQVIPDFMVGDEPYSAELDYMKDGNYKCQPDKEITDEDLKENTYNEAFITMNSDKLLKKIRDLMRERYFYKKKELIQLLNRPKPFPIAQIYSALTQLIEDTNETILDKYGRVGYLVNIGEYYLFQPAELTDKHISIFDRSVPIDFKHGAIQLALPEKEKVKEREKEKKREIQDLEKQMVATPQPLEKEKEQGQLVVEEPRVVEEQERQQKTQSILRMMRENYDTAVEYSEFKEKIPRGDDNWYKHCGKTMQKIHQDYGVPKEELQEFLRQHLVDMLIYDEKVELLETLFSPTFATMNDDFTQKVMDIFQKKIVKTKRFEYIILFENNSKRQILVLNAKTGAWSPAEPEDELEVEEQIVRSLPKEIPYNDIIGFISYEQKNRYLVFKTKRTNLKRNVGARCDESGKNKKLQVLNEILDEKKYTKETSSGMVQQELCSLQEFLLRYYQKIRKNGKVWFLDFETAMLYGL